MMSAKHLTPVSTSGQSIPAQTREIEEVINYAINAYKKKVPHQNIFVLNPTNATGYLAAYVQGALEHQFGSWVLRQKPSERVRVIEHALRAHKNLLPFDMLYTVTPTAYNSSMAVFIDQSIAHHTIGAATR